VPPVSTFDPYLLTMPEEVLTLLSSPLGGDRLLFPEHDLSKDPLGFWETCADQQVTRVTVTPSILLSTLAPSPHLLPPSLRLCFCRYLAVSDHPFEV
jgi:hypothetical protein